MTEDPRRGRFQELSRDAAGLVKRGEYDPALSLYVEAARLAAELGDDELADQAQANCSMVYLERGEIDRAAVGLRELILRSGSDEIVQIAAYNLGSALRRQGRYDKALFYGRMAMDKARELGNDGLVARCRNLVGNIHLNRSQLPQAIDEYRQALGLGRRLGDRFFLAILLENLGYCRLLEGEVGRGHRLLRRALGLAREGGDRRCQAECLQDLAYADLLRNQPADARRYGIRALAMALRMGYQDIEKNSYFLLGEAAQRLGDWPACEKWFSRLQGHYPQIPNLSEFLKTFDVTEVINLKA